MPRILFAVAVAVLLTAPWALADVEPDLLKGWVSRSTSTLEDAKKNGKSKVLCIEFGISRDDGVYEPTTEDGPAPIVQGTLYLTPTMEIHALVLVKRKDGPWMAVTQKAQNLNALRRADFPLPGAEGAAPVESVLVFATESDFAAESDSLKDFRKIPATGKPSNALDALASGMLEKYKGAAMYGRLQSPVFHTDLASPTHGGGAGYFAQALAAEIAVQITR